ncbi:MAG: DegT/DnrJ/EryC1/StrS family aminotransferase [Candidatus Korarchaeota archaeon]
MIPFAKPEISGDVMKDFSRIVSSGMLTDGGYVREFEKQFAAYIGARYGVACSSGTAALHVALQALGIGPGDEVITTPYTFIATANAALFLGAIPVFVDIDEGTFNIDPSKIKERITPKTRAIVAVHLFGHPADMDPIIEVADDHGIPVVEDAAQAHGSKYKGKRVGSIGTIGAFSFYPTKNMTTSEGGMLVTNSAELAEKMRQIVNQGQREKYDHVILGYNYRMTEIAAAIGLEQLKRIEEFNDRRRKIARIYNSAILEKSWFIPPTERDWAHHVYHLYAPRVADEKLKPRVLDYLRSKGVDARGGYPCPLYRQKLFLNVNDERVIPFSRIVRFPDYSKIHLPVTEKVVNQVFHVPLYPALTDENVNYIAELLAHFSP